LRKEVVYKALPGVFIYNIETNLKPKKIKTIPKPAKK